MKSIVLSIPTTALMLSGCAPRPLPPPASENIPAAQALRFDRADGPYTAADALRDFGAAPPPGRDFAEIRGGHLSVLFPEGRKVHQTGFSFHVPVPASAQAELSFRLRYPEDFEAGLHGKMPGFGGGRGYDGGRGDQARDQGDGWSLRMQFDSSDDSIRKTLYLYHADMSGRYGGPPPGTAPFFVRRGVWHQYRLRVTMQSDPRAADGRIQVWLDGAPVIDARDIRFVRHESARAVNRFRFEVFPGGGGNFPSRLNRVEFDDILWRPRLEE